MRTHKFNTKYELILLCPINITFKVGAILDNNMARIDVRDKDPFATADDEPKDNISAGGFLFRAVMRYLKIFIFFYGLAAIIYYFVFGTIPGSSIIPGL